MLTAGQLVWVSKPGNKGAARVVAAGGELVEVKFLELNRGHYIVGKRFVAAMQEPGS